jgi:hypothetical protein
MAITPGLAQANRETESGLWTPSDQEPPSQWLRGSSFWLWRKPWRYFRAKHVGGSPGHKRLRASRADFPVSKKKGHRDLWETRSLRCLFLFCPLPKERQPMGSRSKIRIPANGPRRVNRYPLFRVYYLLVFSRHSPSRPWLVSPLRGFGREISKIASSWS